MTIDVTNTTTATRRRRWWKRLVASLSAGFASFYLSATEIELFQEGQGCSLFEVDGKRLPGNSVSGATASALSPGWKEWTPNATRTFTLDNGLLRMVFDKNDGWREHGDGWRSAGLFRDLRVYGDFTVDWKISWDEKEHRTIAKYTLVIEREIQQECVTLCLFDPWLNSGAKIRCDINGSINESRDYEGLKGNANFRIERRAGVFTIFRDGDVLIRNEADGVITRIKIIAETFRDYQASGMRLSTMDMRLYPSPIANSLRFMTTDKTGNPINTDYSVKISKNMKASENNPTYKADEYGKITIPINDADFATVPMSLLIDVVDSGNISAYSAHRKVYPGDSFRIKIPGKAYAPAKKIKTVPPNNLTQIMTSLVKMKDRVYLDKAGFDARVDLLPSDQGENEGFRKAGLDFFGAAERKRAELSRQLALAMDKNESDEVLLNAIAESVDKYNKDKTALFEKTLKIESAQGARQTTLSPRRDTLKESNLEWINNHFTLKQTNHYGLTPPGYDEALALMAKMDANMLQAESLFKYSQTDTFIKEQYQTAAKNNLRVTPSFYCAFGKAPPPVATPAGYPTGSTWGNPKVIELMKLNLKHIIDKSSPYPAFAGIHFDEINFSGGWSVEDMALFRKYLRGKYTREKLLELGINDVDKVVPPKPEDRYKERVLWMEHQEWVAHTFETAVTELRDYVKQLDPNCLFLPLLSPGPSFFNAPFSASLARLSAIGDSIQVDPYLNGTITEAYICELAKSNARGPVWLTVGTHYGGDLKSLERDYSLSFVHAQGLFVFDWPFIYKYPPANERWRRSWSDGGWQVTVGAFKKASALEPYLVNAESTALVAMLHSERTVSLTSYNHSSFHGFGSNLGTHVRQLIGLYAAITQSRTQIAPIFAEGLTAEKLGKYKALILSDIKSLTEEQTEIIRKWTADGGFLIVTGGSLLLDRWGRDLSNYSLADVLGVKYLKRATGQKTFKFNKDAPLLSEMEVRCETWLPFDETRLVTAKALAEWGNHMPAVTLNQFGKGECLFISFNNPGLCAKAPLDYRQFPSTRTFNPGVKELLNGAVEWGLRRRGSSSALKVENCPEAIEITIKAQPANRRLVVHFINYDQVGPTRGVKVRIRVPSTFKKAYYPLSDVPIVGDFKDGELAFTLRDFDIHELVSIEY